MSSEQPHPLSSDNISNELKAALDNLLLEARQKYGFDFKANKPIECGEGNSRFVWYPTKVDDVPEFYRECSASDAKLKLTSIPKE